MNRSKNNLKNWHQSNNSKYEQDCQTKALIDSNNTAWDWTEKQWKKLKHTRQIAGK